jgi:hypothetical protein
VQVTTTNSDTRVTAFLNSIGRNSKNSQRAYGTALRHFEEFLRPRKQTLDTIIASLANGKANVYELLDQFISYLSKQNIAVTSHGSNS